MERITSNTIRENAEDSATLSAIINLMGQNMYDLSIRQRLWDMRVELAGMKKEKDKVVISMVKV